MDPLTVAQAGIFAHRTWKDADAKVATAAREQGISKEEAWAGVNAAVQLKANSVGNKVLDWADPLGWRAAAQAFKDAEGKP